MGVGKAYGGGDLNQKLALTHGNFKLYFSWVKIFIFNKIFVC